MLKGPLENIPGIGKAGWGQFHYQGKVGLWGVAATCCMQTAMEGCVGRGGLAVAGCQVCTVNVLWASEIFLFLEPG